MDDEASVRDAARRPLEVATRQDGAVSPDPAIVDPAEYSVVFTNLVTGDGDIVGLVAYSIYKQNKYDWLQAYGRLQGRMPNAEEAQSYLLGESTPRRLATYRHLAEAVLDGRGPDVPGAPVGDRPRRDGAGAGASPSSASPLRRESGGRPAQTSARPRFQIGSSAILALGVALVALLVLFWLLRAGAPMPPATPAK